MADLGSLPPWDANAYFRIPTTTTTALGAGATLIAPANPNRVGLIISCPSGSGVVTVGPTPLVTTTHGISLQPFQVPIEILHRDYGPLVAMEWYGASGVMGTQITVIEVILDDLPGKGKPDGP